MLDMNEKNGILTIGKSQFLLSKLRSVTLLEAIDHYKDMCHEDRIRNAWKRANKKK